tara:strand:- start:3804 stop:4040 length:237 start_codon:yes stop_codon:yes gene_type:complete
MMVSPENPNSDIYVISEPNFTESAQCLAFVEQNTYDIVRKATTEYQGRAVEEIYCIDEERLRQVINSLEKQENNYKSI